MAAGQVTRYIQSATLESPGGREVRLSASGWHSSDRDFARILNELFPAEQPRPWLPDPLGWLVEQMRAIGFKVIRLRYRYDKLPDDPLPPIWSNR